ncbi:MAG: hypothetical protein RLZ12_651 [Bacillota bacterium]
MWSCKGLVLGFAFLIGNFFWFNTKAAEKYSLVQNQEEIIWETSFQGIVVYNSIQPVKYCITIKQFAEDPDWFGFYYQEPENGEQLCCKIRRVWWNQLLGLQAEKNNKIDRRTIEEILWQEVVRKIKIDDLHKEQDSYIKDVIFNYHRVQKNKTKKICCCQ